MLNWDIDWFPLKAESAFDPKKPYDPDWAEREPKPVLRSGDEGNIFNGNPQPHDHYGDGMAWSPDSHGAAGGTYNMPGITHPYDEYDDDEEREPADYHVVTGHVDSQDPAEWTEHNYTMFEHPDSNYDTDAAWDYFQQDHPEYNPERNIDATHEVKHVHPVENHDAWHNNLSDEDRDFRQIVQHGLEREAPNIPGNRTYTHTDPHGGTHRLWHNETHYNVGAGTINADTHGPGWRTSYYDPDLRQEQQSPWSFHGDNTYAPLSEALDRIDRNKVHADIAHSGTGLKQVENLTGRHYTSRRPDGSTQQLLYNQGRGDGSNNWMLAHYAPQSTDHTVTYHGADLPGALEQARRNLARG